MINNLHSIYLAAKNLKLVFLVKENLKKCINFEERKGTKYIRGNVYFAVVDFEGTWATFKAKLEKNFLYFRKLTFLALRLKTFLFSQKKFFLYLGK